MSEQNLLNAVAGFREAWQAKQALAQTGSDFREIRGEVASTVVQLHPKRLALQVAEIIDETASTRTLRLVAADGGVLPPFQAGQYINLFVDIDGVATARPYALSSSPAQRSHYDLTVKRAANGFISNYLLDRAVVGQRLLSSGPMGSFHHNPLFHGDDLVFLAGGSGAAPARSILLDILERGLPYRFHLVYVNSFLDDVIFDDELRGLADRHPNFTLSEVISRPPAGHRGHVGRLTQAMLGDLLGEIGDKMFYVCGPTPFNDSCIELLTALGVRRRRIRVEANGAPKAPNEQAGWPEGVSLDDEVTVTVNGRGQFRSRVGEPLLNALERNGYGTENACRSGECSLCRVKLLRGTVFNPQEAHLRKSDRDFGWIYSCVAFPTGDIEILL
ncbi:2Fe-2S iron-sulfur cluster-binding protein [Pseudomonas vanderleydeniana]|uniref:2Fe-2S iron-sulfur cluster binding domain-containing protein n=1 Tax=Pseudomonas vanderleydeniana TaxID=2745495 RepID=A0A9E6PGP5_9PSED|nr:2Fe-2S iron-sulfur cluster-binding protein [Pseudomonas vanderleydeniana]QXI26109.1 2Fe-2S iron-sulfur cluster binding domain-containing protein [Pseudomonas vanderleydeniana]